MRLALWAVGLIAAGWILGRFRTLVILTVVVAVITFPIFPLVDWFQRRGRMPRSAAAALVLLGVTVFLLVALAVVIPWVLHQGQLLISIAPRGIAAVTEYLAQWEARVGEPTFPQFLRTAWQRAGETAVGAANAAAARAVNLMVGWFGQIYLLLLVPFVIYFVLMDYRETRQAVLSLRGGAVGGDTEGRARLDLGGDRRDGGEVDLERPRPAGAWADDAHSSAGHHRRPADPRATLRPAGDVLRRARGGRDARNPGRS